MLKKWHVWPGNVIMQDKPVLINELRGAFLSLKLNKSPGCDKISFNIIKKWFNVNYKNPSNVFNLSIETGVLPDKLKIARVSPVCNTGDNSDLNNRRLISVFPCFSKILDRIIYNHLLSNVFQEFFFQINSVFTLPIQQSMLSHN